MKKYFPKLLLLALILLFAGPAAADSSSIFGNRDPYFKVLKKFTRKGTELALGDLDTRYIWYATFRSDEFRDAFAAYFKKQYPEGQENLAGKLAKPWMEPSPNAEFFVALYCHDSKLGELGGAESLWDLTLQSGGQILKPLLVEPIEFGPFEARFFPYVMKWYKLYRVVFAGGDWNASGRPFTLNLTGIVGSNSLKF